MSSALTSTRDAIVALINGVSPPFAPVGTCQAVWDIYFNLQQLTGGQMIVVPRRKECDPFTRGGARKRVITIDIAIQFAYANQKPTPTLIDPYMIEAEAIADFLERQNLSNGATILHVAHPVIMSDEQMQKARVFCTVLSASATLLQ